MIPDVYIFVVGQKVRFSKEGESLIGPREGWYDTGYDNKVHTVVKVEDISLYVPVPTLHCQMVTLDNGHKYSGWYFIPAE